MEKISWTDHVRNEEVLLRVNEQRNILHEIRKRKANCIGHILRRNCLLKQVIEGKIKGEMEVARRRGRRRKKLLDDLKDRRGYSYLREEALHRTIWRHRFGGGFGPVVRQNTEKISSCIVHAILVRFEWNLNLIDRFSKNIQESNFMTMCPVEAETFHVDGWMDRWTNKMKLIMVVCNFVNTLKLW